ncbi:hypothetical protein [Stieleria maiorica]|nr:hypothetical protein [Stieleria maiorica]
MLKLLIASVAYLAIQAFSHAQEFQDAETQRSQRNAWIGVYTSPSEVGRFTGTKLKVDKDGPDKLGYQMQFYSDFSDANDIEQEELSGQLLVEENRLYLPEAHGSYRKGKPQLFAMISRYTKVQIGGRTVLLQDDAYSEFQRSGKLYDYGILIKVTNKSGFQIDYRKAPHLSIKTLSMPPTAPWKDPFVHGPNEPSEKAEPANAHARRSRP